MDATVVEAGVGAGKGDGEGGVEAPPVISASRQDTNNSSVNLQTQSHLNVTGPDGMLSGKLTV